MADFMFPEARSRIMASIRGRDTRPEMHVRRAVWRRGFRYRLHARRLPGRPDLALAKYAVAVFVHGCFWHQHGCPQSRRPSSNREYWERKLEGNVARDAYNQAKLQELGWTVTTVWECRLEQDTEEVIMDTTITVPLWSLVALLSVCLLFIMLFKHLPPIPHHPGSVNMRSYLSLEGNARHA